VSRWRERRDRWLRLSVRIGRTGLRMGEFPVVAGLERVGSRACSASAKSMECRLACRCLRLMSIRGRLAGIALLLQIPIAPASLVASAEAAVVSVEVERHADVLVIEASTHLKSDAKTAWRVLTDYDRYGEFIPGVSSSRVVDRRGTRVVVEQSEELALWLLHVPFDVTYAIQEFPPNRVQSRATASALPPLESSYVLTPVASGVRLDYVGRIGRGWLLSGRIGENAVRRDVVRQFTALADEIERESVVAHRAD
jgi:hypothetical protein